MSFSDLISDLETLQKARAARVDTDEIETPDEDDDDEKVRDAAGPEATEKAKESVAEDGKEKNDDEPEPPDDDEKDGEEDGEEDGDEDGEEGAEEDEPFGKAFGVTLDDGTTVEAYDATEIMKSFHARIDAQAARIAEIDLLKAEIDALKNGSAQIANIQTVLEKQTDLIKSLTAQVDKLSSEGRGRKSVLNISEKPTVGDPRPATPSTDEILTKAVIAQRQGRISGLDVARLEAYANRGLPPPADIVSRL